MISRDRFGRGYTAVEMPETLLAVHHMDIGSLLHVRPHPENDGIDAGIELLRALHTLETGWLGIRNTSPTHAFELWYRDGKIQIMFVAGSERAAGRLRKQIMAHYPDAELREQDRLFPAVREDEYAAGARIELKKHTFFPIKTSEGVETFTVDPYRALTSELIGREDSRVVVQVVFRPAKPSWTSGGLLGDDVVAVGEAMKQGEVRGQLRPRVVEASQHRKRAAETVQAQKGKQAFHTNIRVLAIAPDAGDAVARAQGVGAIFEQYYNSVTQQGLRDVPVRGRQFTRLVERMATRSWTDQEMVLTIPELAGIAHIPNDAIETPDMDWNRTQRGAHLPADAEQPHETHER